MQCFSPEGRLGNVLGRTTVATLQAVRLWFPSPCPSAVVLFFCLFCWDLSSMRTGAPPHPQCPSPLTGVCVMWQHPLMSGSDLRATCLPCARQGPDGGRSAEWAPPSAKPASPAQPLVQAPAPGVCAARTFYGPCARPALVFLRPRQARGPDSGRFRGLRGHGPRRQEDVNSRFVWCSLIVRGPNVTLALPLGFPLTPAQPVGGAIPGLCVTHA